MNCPHCKQQNADNRNYCGSCGGLMVQFCRFCGFRNFTADRYCGGCGNALDGSAPRIDKPVLTPSLPLSMPLDKDEIVYKENNDLTSEAAAELILAAKESEQVVEEKAELSINQSDIDALFGG